MNDPVRTILAERDRRIHVEEGPGTFGKRDADGVPRLYVEVRDEKGEVVYQTWQSGPLSDWSRVTLYFDRYALDADGKNIGVSFWD
jgi:hypothetical protein